MNDRPIRWGIVSTGHIAGVLARDIALVASEDGDCELAAVASRELGKAQRFAEEFGVARAYASYAELAADADVDVVYVATPHNDHLASALLMINAGKAVLCEKPLTVSAAETEQMLDRAAQQGVFCMEAVWTRMNPLLIKAAELVGSGELGACRHVSARFGFAFAGEPTHRLLNPDLAGGGVLDLGVYPAHMVDVFLGAPDTITATGSTGATGVDTNATALLGYTARPDRPGATATVHCTLESELTPRLDVLCERGRICIDPFIRPELLQVWREGDLTEETLEISGLGYSYQVREVHARLREGATESPRVPWRSTRSVARVLDAWLAGVHGDPS